MEILSDKIVIKFSKQELYDIACVMFSGLRELISIHDDWDSFLEDYGEEVRIMERFYRLSGNPGEAEAEVLYLKEHYKDSKLNK